MDPASGSQLEGTVNTMKDVFRQLVTACEWSRECAVNVSKIRAQGGTRPGAQEVDAEGALSDVLLLAKQKAKGLESTAESTLRELSVRQGPSEGALSEEERTRRLSEVSLALVSRLPFCVRPFVMACCVLMGCRQLELL